MAEGPAFPRSTKWLAGLLMAAIFYWGLRLITTSAVGITWGSGSFMAMTTLLLAYVYYWMLISRTRIDAHHIEQTWLWPKRVEIAQITQVKFIFIPYMDWLIAPRMVVKVSGRGSYVFNAAEPRVLQAFARLSLGPALPPGL